jgi:hypothetical protein
MGRILQRSVILNDREARIDVVRLLTGERSKARKNHASYTEVIFPERSRTRLSWSHPVSSYIHLPPKKTSCLAGASLSSVSISLTIFLLPPDATQHLSHAVVAPRAARCCVWPPFFVGKPWSTSVRTCSSHRQRLRPPIRAESPHHRILTSWWVVPKGSWTPAFPSI